MEIGTRQRSLWMEVRERREWKGVKGEAVQWFAIERQYIQGLSLPC